VFNTRLYSVIKAKSLVGCRMYAKCAKSFTIQSQYGHYTYIYTRYLYMCIIHSIIIHLLVAILRHLNNSKNNSYINGFCSPTPLYYRYTVRFPIADDIIYIYTSRSIQRRVINRITYTYTIYYYYDYYHDCYYRYYYYYQT